MSKPKLLLSLVIWLMTSIIVVRVQQARDR